MSAEAWILGIHLLTGHAGDLSDPGAHRWVATPGAYAIAPLQPAPAVGTGGGPLNCLLLARNAHATIGPA